MNTDYPFMKSPRCTATSKRTGVGCKAPAMRGCNVCRFHGAGGGAPTGKKNGNFSSGLHTQEAVMERQSIRNLIRECRDTLDGL